MDAQIYSSDSNSNYVRARAPRAVNNLNFEANILEYID